MYLSRVEPFDCPLSEAYLLHGFYVNVIMFYASLGGLLFSSDDTSWRPVHVVTERSNSFDLSIP